MSRNLEEILREREELKKLYGSSRYRRLKYSAIIAIAITIAMQIAMIIWMDDIPLKMMFFMRGCVGLGAIVFVVLVVILSYRVNSEYIKKRGRK